MSRDREPLCVERDPLDGAILVSGDLDDDAARALGPALLAAAGASPGPLRLDLGDLELLDGPATARAITALRDLQALAGALTLFEAPQMLAHTLYKIGALRPDAQGDVAITLEDPRQDEPTTAN